MGNVKDLTGQKFGRLTVVGRGEDYVSPSGKRRPRWVCHCECGGEALCQSGTLHSGRATSCGCYAREMASNRAKSGDKRSADISGLRFERLTAVEPVESIPNKGVVWRCVCDCGTECFVSVRELRSGNTKSCGCLRDENISNVNRTHSASHSRLYNVWLSMRQRCGNENHTSYKHYGGRGISVCDEWNDFVTFQHWALNNGYDEAAPYGECTIDRIDVNGNYEPSNCRWVSMAVQATNKRNSHGGVAE